MKRQFVKEMDCKVFVWLVTALSLFFLSLYFGFDKAFVKFRFLCPHT